MQRLIFAELPGRQKHHHIALTRLRARQRTTLHTHDFPELFLVTRGRGNHWLNGREAQLARGSFVFVRAADCHYYEAVAAEAFEFVNLALAPEWWRHFRCLFAPPFEPEGTVARAMTLAVEATAHVQSRLNALVERGGHDQALLVETMVVLAREWLAPTMPVALTSGAQKSPPEWLARVVRDMQNPSLLTNPLVYWQKLSGRSAEHLARSCRRYFDLPLTELLNRVRIEWVKAQLRRGEDKIAGLAIDAGYQNLGYFYRVFRRLEGCAPRQWLKRRGGAATVPR
jgi:AraC family cel operon transcriptional repressor